MDWQVIATAVSTIGFPILACVALFLYVKEILKTNAEQIEKLTTAHKEETDKMTEALNNNTLVLQKLCDKLSE